MKSSRLQEMKNYVIENGTVSIDDLCAKFQVSKNTVRRDIVDLEKWGILKKVYGGVQSVRPMDLVSFEERNEKNIGNKDAIGAVACKLIEDGDVIFLDSGTTTSKILEHLGGKQITILTNSMEVLVKAAAMDNISLFVIPGNYRKKTNSFSLVDTGAYLDRFNVKKAFMAASGFTLENGATHSSPWEYELKRKMIDSSRKCYLMIDHSKIGKTTLMTYCNAEEIGNIITDELPEREYSEFFKDNDIGVFVANTI